MVQLSVLKTWLVARFSKDERGANLVEYILLIVFIALVVVAAVVTLQGGITNKFDKANNCLGDNTGVACK